MVRFHQFLFGDHHWNIQIEVSETPVRNVLPHSVRYLSLVLLSVALRLTKELEMWIIYDT